MGRRRPSSTAILRGMYQPCKKNEKEDTGHLPPLRQPITYSRNDVRQCNLVCIAMNQYTSESESDTKVKHSPPPGTEPISLPVPIPIPIPVPIPIPSPIPPRPAHLLNLLPIKHITIATAPTMHGTGRRGLTPRHLALLPANELQCALAFRRLARHALRARRLWRAWLGSRGGGGSGWVGLSWVPR